MKVSNRLLIIFGSIIGILIIVTTVLALTNSSNEQPSLLPDNTPDGVVQRFILAVKDGDYQTAYSYLYPYEGGVYLSYDTWRQRLPTQVSDNTSWKATIGQTNIKGGSATVNVIFDIFRPGGPFGNPDQTNQVQFVMTKQAGDWLISSPLYIYWLPYY